MCLLSVERADTARVDFLQVPADWSGVDVLLVLEAQSLASFSRSIYLFERKSYKGRERHRQRATFHLLAHSPNAHSSQAGPGEARNLKLHPCLAVVMGPGTWTIFCCVPRRTSR